jgi:hypothetical protein
MKYFLAPFLAASLLIAAVTEPVLNRAMLIPVEKRIDQRLETLFDEPFLLLGMTRGLYLDKFGAVFSAELQLVSTPGVGTFGFTAPTKDMLVATRKKKLERLPLPPLRWKSFRLRKKWCLGSRSFAVRGKIQQDFRLRS